jgi:hypothetical protein
LHLATRASIARSVIDQEPLRRPKSPITRESTCQ